jgi:hypothetical protein
MEQKAVKVLSREVLSARSLNTLALDVTMSVKKRKVLVKNDLGVGLAA